MEKPAPVQTDTDFFMTKLAIDEYDFRNDSLNNSDKDGDKDNSLEDAK